MTQRQLPRPFAMPWGSGEITEEVVLVRDHWEPTIQLIEYSDGGRAVRFCFYSNGRFNRSPLILDERDTEDLRVALNAAPTIKRILGQLVD